MGTIVVPYEAGHLHLLQLQDAQAFVHTMINGAHAKALEDPRSFSVVGDDGEVYACGGLTELWTHRALAWSLVSRHAGRHMLLIHRAIQRYLDASPFRRIEMEVDCEFEAGHRWARMLGFTMECERMRCHGIDGRDNALYAKVKNHG